MTRRFLLLFVLAIFTSAMHAADLVVAETVRDTTSVWRLHGSERVELVRIAHAPAWDPAVSLSPDGRFVAIAAVTAGTPARIRETALAVVDLETREHRTLETGVSIHDTPRWIGSERVVYTKALDAGRTEEREAAVRERRGGAEETQAVAEESDVRLVRQHFDTYDRFVLRFADGAEKPLQTRGWLKHVGSTSAALVSDQPVELNLRAPAANAVCPQAAAYGQQPYPSALYSVFDQAAQNQLGSSGPAIGTMVKGVPPNHSYVPFSMPKSIIRAIGYFETYAVWKQFNASYGSWGYTVVSADCGYGIMQITSSMSGGGGFDPARVAAEPAYNIGTGALFLRNKWNGEPAYIGNSDPAIYEDWYYAVWDYNGGSDVNNPSNPKYPNPFPVYNGSNRSQMPYQEAIWSLIRNPYADPYAQYNGAPLWNVVNVTSPSRGAIPYPYGTKKPDIPTPQPSHTDGGTQTQTCTSFSVSPSTIYASAPSGWLSVTITGSPSGCTGGSWSAGGNGSWLSVSPASGSGSGSVTVSWTQNTSTSPRTGYGAVAGTTIVVDQMGGSVPSCTYTIDPTSATAGASSGSGSVQVSGSPSGCSGSWSASSSDGWLWLTGTASGSGSGTWQVPYSYSANTGTSSRSATIGVPGSTFTLTQNGAPADYTIALSAAPQAGGTVSGSGTFPAGSSRTATATPNSGYTFINWTENGSVVSNSASYTFTLTASRTLVANFTSTSQGTPHGFLEVSGAAAQVHDLEVAPDGSLFVLFPLSNPSQLAVVKSTDGGQSWGSPVTIPGSGFTNSDYDFDVDSSGTIHVVWALYSANQPYYSRSTNGGASFSTPIPVRSGNDYSGYRTGNAVYPIVSADGLGNLYVAYGAFTQNSSGTFVGYNVWVSRSTNGGSSFEPEFPINTITSAQKRPLRIRAGSAAFSVLYLDETNRDLFFHKSTSGAFASNSRVNSNAGSILYSGDFAAGAGDATFYAVYTDDTGDSEGNVTFCRSTDGGVTWSACVRVNDNSYRWQERPAIEMDGAGRLHVGWTDLRSNRVFQTFYAVSADGGTTFSPNVNVSEPFTDSHFTQVHLAVHDPSSSLFISSTRDYSQLMVARRLTTALADTTPPDTSITSGPAGTVTTADVSFTYSGSDNVTPASGLQYAYRLEPLEASFSAYSSQTARSYQGLTNGSYTFHVRARDAAGNVDPSPASRPFTVSLAQACAYSFSPPSASGTGSGGTGTISVSANPAACSGSWSASSSAAWLTLTGTSSGTGYGVWQVPYSYSANPSNSATRPGTVAFSGPFPAGNTFTLTQNPSAPAGGGIADFSDDGYPDIVWRHTGTGENYLWFMNGSTRIGALAPRALADTNWRIIGVGDFNRDGEPDLAWRHIVTGENYLWYMNGAVQSGGTSLPGVADLNWSAVAVADMNRDGGPDILWRNTATGAVWVWLMNDAAIASIVDLGSVADPQWRIEGAADMNGDGSNDILWRHYGTGEHYIWLMNGTSRVGSGSIPSVTDTTWEIEALADYDGNGSADVVWRQYTTGANYMWLMNGMTPTWRGALPDVTDLQWKIAGPH